MIIESFLRDEQKYFLNKNQFNELFSIINKELLKDKYYKETIYNLYFDTLQNEMIINSLDKPLYKEKIRLRSYEIPNDDTPVFLEIKRKYSGITSKRRIVIKYADALNYLEHQSLPSEVNIQKFKEIDYYFKKYNLVPKLSITYDRLSYLDRNDSTFRLTIDSNLKSSNTILKLADLNESDLFFSDGYIMEIKTLKAMPMWLIAFLNKLQIYPVSFSKYGKIYQKLKESDLIV